MLGGCAFAEIPYDLTGVPTKTRAIHPYKVAIIPLVDDRATGDGPDAERFQYQGVEYAATMLGDLKGEARDRITELVANHLARAHVFAQIILVLDKEQAPEADLFLTGRIYRMRGYVEVEQPDVKPARPADERMVLSEVIIKDLILSDAKNPDRALIKIDAGWTVHEPRKIASGEVTPWDVLGQTLFVALDSAAAELATADLSGKYDVRDRVALELAPTSSIAQTDFGGLAARPPHGWRFTETSSAAAPIGWMGAPRCREAVFEQRQTIRFHRALGPYRPTVRIWSCPTDTPYIFDGRVDFPSRYLGRRVDGSRYFLHALGETNWPGSKEELTRHLRIIAPTQRYVFELHPVD